MLQRISARDYYLMLFSVQNIVHTQMPQHISQTRAPASHTHTHKQERKTYAGAHALMKSSTCSRPARAHDSPGGCGGAAGRTAHLRLGHAADAGGGMEGLRLLRRLALHALTA